MPKKFKLSKGSDNKSSNIEEFIEEIKKNINNDRATADAFLVDLMVMLKKEPHKHQDIGFVAAKYLEVLQRSNEQLVKLVSIMSSKNPAKTSNIISEEEKEEIYDHFQNEATEEKKK